MNATKWPGVFDNFAVLMLDGWIVLQSQLAPSVAAVANNPRFAALI